MLSEILLDVVSYFDYATLVVFRLTSKQLLRFADRYADQLAFRRTFNVLSRTNQALDQFFLEEIRADNSTIRVHTMEVDVDDDERLLGTMAELHSLTGPHAVHLLDLDEIRFYVKPFVEHVPAVRHASEVYLAFASGCSPSLEEYKEIVSLFQRPTKAGFWQIPTKALIAFLESACASKLKDWSARAPRADEYDELEELDAYQENIVFRSFFDFSNLEHGEQKRFMFEGWNLRWDFLRQIIEAADNLQRVLTIEVYKPDWVPAERLILEDDFAVSYCRLPLNPTSFEEKCVAIGDFLRQGQHARNPWLNIAYFSKQSDVVVFVDDYTLTITNQPGLIDFSSLRYF